LVDLFVAVLFACWLEGGRERESLEWSVGEVECPEPLVLAIACRKYLSLSFFYMFYGIFFWRKRCGFSSLPQPGILICEKYRENYRILAFHKSQRFH
jgi:hypothetical protein